MHRNIDSLAWIDASQVRILSGAFIIKMEKKGLEFMDMYLDENSNHYFTIWNKKSEELGRIEFDMKWKKWIWIQYKDIVMSESCLQQVIDKIKELKKPKNKQ